MNLDPKIIQALIPIISVLATFGMPVAIVFIVKHFKLRNRELEAEIEARKFWNESERAQFQSRIERLESALFQRAIAPMPDRGLLEGPPGEEASRQMTGRRDPLGEK
jgi:hypothetical protein